jgi:alkylation response protein AidB-like acyl-CoA dehydrogenase
LQRLDEMASTPWAPMSPAPAPGARGRLEPAAVGPEHGLTTMARYLNNRAASIYGGSNEIQRDIIARLVLGL